MDVFIKSRLNVSSKYTELIRIVFLMLDNKTVLEINASWLKQFIIIFIDNSGTSIMIVGTIEWRPVLAQSRSRSAIKIHDWY